MTANQLKVPMAACGCILLLFSLPIVSVGEAVQKKKEDAEERRLRNEIKERDQQIQKLRKELEDHRSDVKKIENELAAWKKKPVVPTDNVALVPYDTSGLFAKDQPNGTGPVVMECKKGATLLIVWKHSGAKSDGKSVKWEYATVRLTPEGAREIRINLHKGDWSFYRSNPKAGYVHLGDVKVSDKAATLAIPDSN